MRVHGGEGVKGGVGVHTLDLPNSLAWLSPKEELTFGHVDHTMQLRWFTLGRQQPAYFIWLAVKVTGTVSHSAA